MTQAVTDKNMIRREFLGWLCKIGGGCTALTLGGGLAPLRKINTVLLSEAHAASCGQDICTTADSSGECATKDVCDEDSSDICTNDECTSDKLGACTNDKCESDSSGECKGDTCLSDSSKGCETDNCQSDKSGACLKDTCESDSSGACEDDTCIADASGAGVGDECTADASGACVTDFCLSDKSGACKKDTCTADKSGGNWTDGCEEDFTPGSQVDFCFSDSSGRCSVNDSCTADSSNVCNVSDVCVRDNSNVCDRDLCRDDRTPAETICASDTCAQDLALNNSASRRQFAKSSLNQALKMLYKLVAVILFIGIFTGQSRAEINAADAAFSPAPSFVTSQTVSVPEPAGPFLRDCDNDGILEADVNGDGQCTGDPELKDYNGDGSIELPEGTQFSGRFQFTCFFIPDNAAIIATGPLTVAAAEELAVFGAVRLPNGGAFSCPGNIDLHTSAWLAENGSISFATATAGPVITDPDPEIDLTDAVPAVDFISSCLSHLNPESIPTLNEWGLIIMSVLLALSAIWMIRRRQTIK